MPNRVDGLADITKSCRKTIKSFITSDQPSAFLPLCRADIIFTNDEDKANILNQFYCQTFLDDSNASLLSVSYTPLYELEFISISALLLKLKPY